MNLKFAALGMALPIELIFCQLHLTNSHLAVLLAIYPSPFFLRNCFCTLCFRTAFKKDVSTLHLSLHFARLGNSQWI